MAKRILIVDDAAFMRLTLRKLLEKAGYEVVGEAETGEAGAIKFEQLKPDLVTMDIVMLGAGGIKAVKTITQQHPEAKILMVSAIGQQALIVDAIRAGAKGFIVKPFKPEEVMAEIERITAE